MKRWGVLIGFLLVVGLLATTAVAAQAYRWVDENGVVHYSDRPELGAEQILLQDSNTTTVRRPAQLGGQSADDQEAEEEEGPFRYESIEVASPGAEETLWNIDGVLNVSIALTPALRPGHQVRVYFDGEPRMVTGTSFQIQEVWRGVHNIQVEVLNEGGELMIRSRTNRFYVQQNAVNF